MTPQKHREVIAQYRTFFEECGIEAIDFPHDQILRDGELALGHCHGMLDKMESFIDEGRMDKVNRWLGFIQGVLWRNGDYQLDELKDTNRPVDEQQD
mgnify:CR=1 FL=1